MDHELRRRRLVERLDRLGVGALLITSRANLRYLTGFTGSNGALLVHPAELVLFTDGRYEGQTRRQAAGVEVAICSRLLEEAGARAARLGARLGFEGTLPYRDFGRLADGANGALEMISVNGAVESLRITKDEDEIASVQRAQALTDDAFEDIAKTLRENVTESELALELEVAMRRAGAEAVAFDPIVAFGEHAAEPHHAPCDRALRAGDIVKLDFGARVDGYHADMTRSIAFGEPPAELRRVHGVVARAQAAGVEAVRPGASCGAVDRAAREVIREAGFGDRYTHSTGHGVGLEIHEAPWLRADDTVILSEGAVVTVEPGVYLPGVGGVRIEDIVLVEAEGPRVLPRSTRELVVV